jgi:hypothetical protein
MVWWFGGLGVWWFGGLRLREYKEKKSDEWRICGGQENMEKKGRWKQTCSFCGCGF